MNPLARLASVDPLRCPYCHADLLGQAIARCPTCATPHHTLCFNEGGCTVLGCPGTWVVQRGWNDRPHRRLGQVLFAIGAAGFLALGLANHLLRPRHLDPHLGSRCAAGSSCAGLTYFGKGQSEPRVFSSEQGFSWSWDREHEAVEVVEVALDSQAALLGLSAGDRITHFDEVPASPTAPPIREPQPASTQT